jgi:hypothetical protein
MSKFKFLNSNVEPSLTFDIPNIVILTRKYGPCAEGYYDQILIFMAHFHSLY